MEIRCRSSCHFAGSSATLLNSLHSSITGVKHAASTWGLNLNCITWGPSDVNMRGTAERPRWPLAQVLAVLTTGRDGDITKLRVKSEISFMFKFEFCCI